MTTQAARPPVVLVCACCGDVILLGEPMYWTHERAGLVWHEACAQTSGLLEPPAPPPKRRRRPVVIQGDRLPAG